MNAAAAVAQSALQAMQHKTAAKSSNNSSSSSAAPSTSAATVQGSEYPTYRESLMLFCVILGLSHLHYRAPLTSGCVLQPLPMSVLTSTTRPLAITTTHLLVCTMMPIPLTTTMPSQASTSTGTRSAPPTSQRRLERRMLAAKVVGKIRRRRTKTSRRRLECNTN